MNLSRERYRLAREHSRSFRRPMIEELRDWNEMWAAAPIISG
jgi:hypothetical protein